MLVGMMAGCTDLPGVNSVWYEATADGDGTVISQGPGEPLRLGCDVTGTSPECRWTIRMRLVNAEPLTRWAQDLVATDADADVLAVESFGYELDLFETPFGGEAFGAAVR
jgi:hypothetical protein